MSIQKSFNDWISRKFKGLSTHTLCQFIGMELDFLPTDYISNMVYVDLFHVFTKKATQKEQDSFDVISVLVENCTWL